MDWRTRTFSGLMKIKRKAFRPTNESPSLRAFTLHKDVSKLENLKDQSIIECSTKCGCECGRDNLFDGHKLSNNRYQVGSVVNLRPAMGHLSSDYRLYSCTKPKRVMVYKTSSNKSKRSLTEKKPSLRGVTVKDSKYMHGPIYSTKYKGCAKRQKYKEDLEFDEYIISDNDRGIPLDKVRDKMRLLASILKRKSQRKLNASRNQI